MEFAETVVLSRASSGEALRVRSLQAPGTIFVGIHEMRCAAYNGILAYAPIRTIRIFLWICAARGRVIDRLELAELLFGHRADGGPEQADHVIRVEIHALRTFVIALGLVLRTDGHNGYAIDFMRKSEAA